MPDIVAIAEHILNTSSAETHPSVNALAQWALAAAPLIEQLRVATDELDAYLASRMKDRNWEIWNERIRAKRAALRALLAAVGP